MSRQSILAFYLETSLIMNTFFGYLVSTIAISSGTDAFFRIAGTGTYSLILFLWLSGSYA